MGLYAFNLARQRQAEAEADEKQRQEAEAALKAAEGQKSNETAPASNAELPPSNAEPAAPAPAPEAPKEEPAPAPTPELEQKASEQIKDLVAHGHTEALAFDASKFSIPEIREMIASGSVTKEVALASEKSGKNRATLVKELES